MPSQSEITPPPHKAAPLGVDRKAMVMAACRFAAPFLHGVSVPPAGGYVHQVTRSTSHSNASGYESSTIDKMCMVFSTHGLPQTLMTNNGSVFTSVHFADFVQRNIRHFTSSPHHPATNSLVEWAVQTFKGAIKRPEQQCTR